MRNHFRTIEHLESRQLFAAGDVDPSFSDGSVRGEYVLPPTIGYHDFNAAGSLVAADGSVFAYGQQFVAKFLRNGALDQTFGRGGVAGFEGIVRDGLTAALDSRGRIVLAGRSNDSEPKLAVMRMDQSGAIDASFADGGLWTTSALTVASPVSVGVDQADRPLIGLSIVSAHPATDIQIVRLTQDGNIDRRFGDRGVSLLNLVAGQEAVEDLHVGPDGRIGFLVTNEERGSVAVARLNSRGVLDRSFDGNGVAAVNFGEVGYNPSAHLLTLPNGRLSAVLSAGGDVFAIRFMPDGSRDLEFGGDGIVSGDEWISPSDERFDAFLVHSIASYSDGLLGVFGRRFADDKDVLLKIRGNGSLSPGFGKSGVRVLRFYDGLSNALEMHPPELRSDDTTVVLRRRDEYSYEPHDFEIVSLGTDGKKDAAFSAADAGRIFTPTKFGSSAVLVDGRLLLPGFRNQGVNMYAVTESGSLDNHFGSAGRVDQGDFPAAVLIPQSDGGFVQWGASRDSTDGDSIAVVITGFAEDGTWQSISPAMGSDEFFITDDSGGGIVSLLPRGWISITYEVLPFDSRYGLLISPAGQAVNTPFQISRGGEYTDYPENDALVGVLPGPGGSVYGFGQKPLYENDVQVVRDVILRAGGDVTLPAFGVDDTVFNVSGVIASDLQGRILYRTRSGIRRLNLDGSRDMSFGNKGTASVVAGYDHLDIDSQGRLIAWRVIRGGAADGDIQVMRLTPNGKLDATFGGGDGVAVVDTRFSSTADTNVIITPDDKIVVTAMRQESTRVRWSATRLLAN